uniref:Transcriptional regulator, AbiEi antitoxin, Type IV TA system n=1 Tax=Streptomyces sp. NBC_00049 TaxID=2903617 RepID=A0AAU2JQN9_9ACTN
MITAQQPKVARRQLGLATRHQLTAAGVPGGTVTSRTRPGGPWQRLLPRVYLLQTGPPDHRQRALAAVLYAAADPLSGDTAALTGGAALALLGIREAPYTPADVLIRAPRGLGGTPEVRPLPTARWPRTITVSGVPSTRPVRAAADFAARADQPDRIRSVLAHVVQAGWCHPHDLHAELRSARLLSRPAIRAAAAELLAGVRSIAEARARDTLTATDLPTPLWNARLHTPDGTFLASPDAYWPDEGVALEIDSAEYHYTRDAWHATLRRRLRLESHGILVVSATPSMIRDTPAEVLTALRALLTLAATRPTPPTALARGHQQLTLFPGVR